MQRVKRRIFSGAVCEQEVYYISDRSCIKTAAPRVRFRTDEERAAHRSHISRKRHTRLVNENFGPSSWYVTLTLDEEHEVHDFKSARRVRDNYIRRLRSAAPDAKIIIYMGRGKSTSRIHFHLLVEGADKETILGKWTEGSVVRCDHLREHNYYIENGARADHGRDYTSLANYLFNHWTPEQGERSHRYKATKNLRKPEEETPKEVKRNYTPERPPAAPRGYRLVEARATEFGYLYFKYVYEPGKRRKRE